MASKWNVWLETEELRDCGEASSDFVKCEDDDSMAKVGDELDTLEEAKELVAQLATNWVALAAQKGADNRGKVALSLAEKGWIADFFNKNFDTDYGEICDVSMWEVLGAPHVEDVLKQFKEHLMTHNFTVVLLMREREE